MLGGQCDDFKLKKPFGLHGLYKSISAVYGLRLVHVCKYGTVLYVLIMVAVKLFKPVFTIVIFIHYKPRIAVAILALQWMKMT